LGIFPKNIKNKEREMFKKGEKRIANVIEKFTSLVDELEKGMIELVDEQGRNAEAIRSLEARNTTVEASITQATNVAAKLRALVS